MYLMLRRLVYVLIFALCISTPSQTNAAAPSADWTMWGYNTSNQRYNPNETTITATNVGNLKLKWAFAFPFTQMASNQPTVVGDTVYVGSWNGKVYALDAATGKQKWAFSTDYAKKQGVVRVGISVAGKLLLFGDQLGRFFAVDRETGKMVWIQDGIEKHPDAQITGSPVVYGDKVYVPMSSREESEGQKPTYRCCTFRGSLTALNLSDGKVLWQYYTVGEPKETGNTSASIGPSGVGLWSTPAVDPDAGLIYVTTGNNYSLPVTDTSDAILAINMADGTLYWSTQITPSDYWNFGCSQTPPINCDADHGDDYDFSSSPLLLKTGDQKLVIGIQKNGNMTALNALTGKIIWKQSVGETLAINWGMAFDGHYIYTGDASDQRQGGVYAIDPSTGQIVWQSKTPDCIPGPTISSATCWSGNMTAVSASPGLVWVPATDGQLYAFGTATGKLLWSYNTAKSFKTVNGVVGHGGSIGAAGATIANGQIYVTSGYPLYFNGIMGGNVLLAFGFETETF